MDLRQVSYVGLVSGMGAGVVDAGVDKALAGKEIELGAAPNGITISWGAIVDVVGLLAGLLGQSLVAESYGMGYEIAEGVTDGFAFGVGNRATHFIINWVQTGKPQHEYTYAQHQGELGNPAQTPLALKSGDVPATAKVMQFNRTFGGA